MLKILERLCVYRHKTEKDVGALFIIHLVEDSIKFRSLQQHSSFNCCHPAISTYNDVFHHNDFVCFSPRSSESSRDLSHILLNRNPVHSTNQIGRNDPSQLLTVCCDAAAAALPPQHQPLFAAQTDIRFSFPPAPLRPAAEARALATSARLACPPASTQAR